MGIGMGIGALGSPNLVFKRKFRWTLAISGPAGDVPDSFVKVAARPNITIEETQIDFLNGRMWIPGKGSLETITITYLDVAGNSTGGQGGSGALENLWGWLAAVYDFTGNFPDSLNQASTLAGYSGDGNLTLYDGCGNALEQWTMFGMWPTTVNFGELDMSSPDTVDIEMTFRYAAVQYQNLCGNQFKVPECTGCA